MASQKVLRLTKGLYLNSIKMTCIKKKTGEIAVLSQLVVSLPSMKKALIQFPASHETGMVSYVCSPNPLEMKTSWIRSSLCLLGGFKSSLSYISPYLKKLGGDLRDV